MKTAKPISLAILSSLLALMIFSSCHKIPAPISLSDYPNKIGDQWVYFVYDSIAHTSDTLKVTVVSASSLNGASTLLWQYSYSNGYVDTLQTLVSGDTIGYYSGPSLLSVQCIILFPLMNGSHWTYSNYATYTASYLGGFSYLNQSYSNVYMVNHIEEYPNYHLIDNIYMMPNVGIIHRKMLENDFGPTINQIWTLINYRLN